MFTFFCLVCFIDVHGSSWQEKSHATNKENTSENHHGHQKPEKMSSFLHELLELYKNLCCLEIKLCIKTCFYVV